MDLAAAGRLDEALWQQLPAEWLDYLSAVQRTLEGTRDQSAQGPSTKPLVPKCGDPWTWDYAFKHAQQSFDGVSRPNSPYYYPVPAPSRSTRTTVTNPPDPGARIASVSFIDGATPKSAVVLTGAAAAFTWRGELTSPIDRTYLTLRGLDDQAEFTCQGRPADGLVARIRIKVAIR